MQLIFFTDLDLDLLHSDKALDIARTDEGVFVAFKDEEKSLFFEKEDIIIGDDNKDYLRCCSVEEEESLALAGYLAEKFRSLVMSYDSVLYDICDQTIDTDGVTQEAADAIYNDSATLEMLFLADQYGWSQEFIEYIRTERKIARESLGVDAEYKVGDRVVLDYCGDELITKLRGEIIYVDSQYAIAQFTADFCQQMDILNRNEIPDKEVEEIIGKPIETIRKKSFDAFIDMYNPLSYLANRDFLLSPLTAVPVDC